PKAEQETADSKQEVANSANAIEQATENSTAKNLEEETSQKLAKPKKARIPKKTESNSANPVSNDNPGINNATVDKVEVTETIENVSKVAAETTTPEVTGESTSAVVGEQKQQRNNHHQNPNQHNYNQNNNRHQNRNNRHQL